MWIQRASCQIHVPPTSGLYVRDDVHDPEKQAHGRKLSGLEALTSGMAIRAWTVGGANIMSNAHIAGYSPISATPHVPEDGAQFVAANLFHREEPMRA
jgi:hypothetical protein